MTADRKPEEGKAAPWLGTCQQSGLAPHTAAKHQILKRYLDGWYPKLGLGATTGRGGARTPYSRRTHPASPRASTGRPLASCASPGRPATWRPSLAPHTVEAMSTRDTWTTRDYPVLVAVAEHLEETRGAPVLSHQLAKRLPSHELRDITHSLTTLVDVYVRGEIESTLGDDTDDVIVTGLTERGRRAAGLWPAEGADRTQALVEAIRAAAEQADTEDERSRLRKAADALAGAAGRVTEGAIAAVVAGVVSGGM